MWLLVACFRSVLTLFLWWLLEIIESALHILNPLGGKGSGISFVRKIERKTVLVICDVRRGETAATYHLSFESTLATLAPL